MDAARRHKDETIRPHGPADFARGEESAEGGRGNREKYHRRNAAELIQHKRWEESLESRNLGDVPNQVQNSKRKTQNYWTAENPIDQRVAVSGSESEARPDPGRNPSRIRDVTCVIVQNPP